MIIVTDSAVDLPDWLEESPAIRKVSGRLWLGSDPLRGGTEQFWSLVRDHQYPSTTPPTVSDLTEAYRHHDLVIGLHVSAILSATASHAREAATRAGPGAIVIDTRSFSVGAGLVVAAVHRAARESAGTRVHYRVRPVASGPPPYIRTHRGDRDASEKRSLRSSSSWPLGKEPPSPAGGTRKGDGTRAVQDPRRCPQKAGVAPGSECGAGFGRSLGYRTRRRCRRNSAHEIRYQVKSVHVASFCDPSRSDSRSAPWSGFRCRWSDLGSR